ncbi:MAG: polymerase [Chloroflexi bacterium AL-W]|nr:polymerase [Chloroflexi bacterium AL-W]
MQLSNAPTGLQIWFTALNRRTAAIIIGVMIGAIGGALGVAVAVINPLIVVGGVVGGLIGLYLLTDLRAALYSVILILMLLPFGTVPFDIGFTPTLLDATIGVVLLIYLLEWMRQYRQALQLTPIHMLVLIYLLWLLLAFALGLRHAPITTTIARQFAETLLAIGLTFILVDILRERKLLRRLVLVILIGAALQAMITIALYFIPDETANLILNRLARFGYPTGGVIQYIESNRELGERAIGTWIAPNSLGGMLAISAVIIAPQVFAPRPVFRYRWLTLGVLGLIGIALILTFSRASALAFTFGLLVITLARYRRFLPVLALAGGGLLLLPQSQYYLSRFIEAFTATDLATQMRIGEWTDSLRLISRYPVTGVGFTGTPDIDLYTDVANMYLIMANQIGLVGVAIFLTLMLGVLAYGMVAWRYARQEPELEAIHLGFHAALVTALINAVADLYFFRLDFQPLITLFWLVVALSLASSRLVLSQANTPAAPESTVAKV